MATSKVQACPHKNCHHLNRRGARFCARCGRSIHTRSTRVWHRSEADATVTPSGIALARPIAVADPTSELRALARANFAQAEVRGSLGDFAQAEARASGGAAMLLPRSSRLAALADIGMALPALVVLESFAYLVLVVCVGWGLPGLDPAQPELDRMIQIPGLGLTALASFVTITAILALRRQSARSVGVTTVGLGLNLLIGLGAAISLYLFLFGAGIALLFLAPELLDGLSENAERLVELLPKLTLPGFAAVAMIVGIYEELLFRGFLMTRLRRATGGWTWAVVISTLIFTALHAVHQVPAALPLIAVLSVSFSVLTIWRRSIVPAVVAHALFDFVQFIFLDLQMGDSWT